MFIFWIISKKLGNFLSSFFSLRLRPKQASWRHRIWSVQNFFSSIFLLKKISCLHFLFLQNFSNQQNIFNQILSVFASDWMLLCVCEKFKDFFVDTSNSMASTFLGLDRCEQKLLGKFPSYFEMIQKIKCKIKGTRNSLDPWLLRQKCWTRPMVSLSLVTSLLFWGVW